MFEPVSRFYRRAIHAVRWRWRARHPLPHPGETFRATVLARYGVSSPEEAPNETVRMWIDFALSTTQRGWHAVDSLGGDPVFRGKRVLDIGCAYGGFLVAAKQAGASSVTGIDISPDLILLAELQLADHGVTATLSVDDITLPDIARRLGRFDIVLCNDVIEHVVEPAVCAAHLAAMLSPQGSVFLEIPNGQAVDFMLSDGHYGLFGITLLDRRWAEQWWDHHYGPNDRYGVEHYAPLDYYLDIFSHHGVSLRLLNSADGHQEAAVTRLEQQFGRLEGELAGAADRFPNAPPGLIAEMRRRGAEEITAFRQLLARYRTSTVPAERTIIGRTLVITYGLTFWTLHGVKLAG